uniref:Uncharacterized protein n=1 Tax=Rangifer tarandus platyrhynchus TaxID=3082113 RepID=A0ACB0DUH8_RANTA|nr:unnamed protein product [Rangifer tarandus platyrhynchus]
MPTSVAFLVHPRAPLPAPQPPTTPTPRHRGNLTPYTGCYTCAENKQGASVCWVRVGAAWRPQRKPAAPSLVKPALGWEPNHTPPSPRLTPVYPGVFSPLPRPPLDSPGHSSSRQPFSQRSEKAALSPSLPAGEGSLGALRGSLGVGPDVGGEGAGNKCGGYPEAKSCRERPAMVSRSLRPLRHSRVPWRFPRAKASAPQPVIPGSWGPPPGSPTHQGKMLSPAAAAPYPVPLNAAFLPSLPPRNLSIHY